MGAAAHKIVAVLKYQFFSFPDQFNLAFFRSIEWTYLGSKSHAWQSPDDRGLYHARYVVNKTQTTVRHS